MEKNKISILIPTRNRYKCILDIFSKISEYSGELFSFIFYDSSDTFDINKCLPKENNDKIKIVKFESNTPLEEKVLNSYKNLKTKYGLLCSDSQLMDFNKLERFLININFDHFDIININLNMVENFESKDFSDVSSFYVYSFSYMTKYGSYIVSNKIVKLAFKNNIYSKYMKMKSVYSYVSSICEASFYCDDFKATMLKIDKSIVSLNSKRGLSYWKKSGDALNYMFGDFIDSVDANNFLDEKSKDIIIRKYVNDWHVFDSFKQLYYLKKYNNLTKDKIDLYMDRIVKYLNNYRKLLFIYKTPIFISYILFISSLLVEKFCIFWKKCFKKTSE